MKANTASQMCIFMQTSVGNLDVMLNSDGITDKVIKYHSHHCRSRRLREKWLTGPRASVRYRQCRISHESYLKLFGVVLLFGVYSVINFE